MKIDYKSFYDLEKYLFDDVRTRFADSGEISAFDFYCILVWKANRAKNKHKERLTKISGSFEIAVEKIGCALREAKDSRTRLAALMLDWKFRLPTATAILAVLYPTDFTVYDVRVCNELNKFHNLTAKPFSDELWLSYQKFIQAVIATTPPNLSLRDRDRYLWGRSFFQDAKAWLGTNKQQ